MGSVSKIWLIPGHVLALALILSQSPCYGEVKTPGCKNYPVGRSYSVQLGSDLIFQNTSQSISPDGAWVLLKDGYGPVRLFSVSTGKEQEFPLEVGSTFPEFSPDGKTLLVRSPEGKVTLFDLKTGQKRPLIHPTAFVVGTQFSPDGKAVMTASLDGKVLLHDLANGKARSIQFSDLIKSVRFTPDGKFLFAQKKHDPNYGVLLDLQTGTQVQILRPSGISQSEFSPDGKYVIAGSAKAPVLRRLGQIQNSDQEQIDLGLIISAQFSNDGKRLFTTQSDGKFVVRDLTTGVRQSFDGGPSGFGLIQTARFSPDGKWLYYVAQGLTGKGFSLFNLDTHQTHEINFGKDADVGLDSRFSPDGKFYIMGTLRGEVIIRNLSTGTDERFMENGSVISTEISKDGKVAQSITNQHEFRLMQLAAVCVDPTLSIRAQESCTLCRNNPVLASEQMLNELQQEARCHEAFDPNLWDKGNTPQVSESLTDESAKALLLRFQKPGGFDPQKHLPQLLAIFKSDLPQRKPDLVMGALQTVMHTSNQLYERLLLDFPTLTRLKSNPSATPNACRTPEEVRVLEKASIDYLKNLTTQNPRSKFKDWQGLAPLSPLLSKLSPEQKEDYIDKIAQSLADTAADSAEFHGIFLSKLYKFTSQAAARLLGEKPKSLADLTLIRESDFVRPVLLGVEPLDTLVGSETEYGFYAKSLPPVSTENAKFDKKIRWRMGDEPYQAQLSIEVLSSTQSIVPQGLSPNYSELWKGGTLTGLVITGSNLKGSAADVMGQYLAYYQEQGFKFQPITAIQDAPSFLQGKIVSGELRYLIKEAHSDGDEKNLFRLNLKAQLQTGERILPDGRIERVHLLFPAPRENATVLLSNQKFAEMLKLRENAGHGQFVYFNTSCWSKTKAIYEIEAAQTPLLLNVPSTTTVQTFTNEPKDAERLMLTAFRNGKTFDEMRQALRENSEYQSGHQNHFIFPDDPEYQTAITAILAKPIKTEIKILGPDGKPYQIDEAH